MPSADIDAPADHSHVFLGAGHARNERRTWVVIGLCGAMMLIEIVGGLVFGSIALVADGLHMSTHAGALLLAALAYSFSRKLAHDPRFTFGTGKLGDLAGFTSAIVLAMIALLIGYESVVRFLHPTPIRFEEAIPIAVLGLMVNIASAWLLSSDHDHHHGHGHGRHGHGAEDDAHPDEAQVIETGLGPVRLEVFEDGVPPRFRLSAPLSARGVAARVEIETVRPDGGRQQFAMVDRGDHLESRDEIPEPHAFVAHVRIGAEEHSVVFDEHDHAHDRDNNMRAAVVHVLADAAVSVLVIAGLVLAKVFGWLWMDAVAGCIGAVVIANWSYGLIRDTGAILLDMNPDRRLANRMRGAIASGGDSVGDLHLWRLGPGHLGAIVSVATVTERSVEYYRAKLRPFRAISHLTIEVTNAAPDHGGA